MFCLREISSFHELDSSSNSIKVFAQTSNISNRLDMATLNSFKSSAWKFLFRGNDFKRSALRVKDDSLANDGDEHCGQVQTHLTLSDIFHPPKILYRFGSVVVRHHPRDIASLAKLASALSNLSVTRFCIAETSLF